MTHQHVAYLRVSTRDQSVHAQRSALAKAGCPAFDREVIDEGISGATMASQRPGFSTLLAPGALRKGDTLYVFAIDRLGRDSIDVQTTVRDLLAKGVALYVLGLGLIVGDVGRLLLALLAQLSEMERNRIRDRTEAGMHAARASLAATGKTHRGKLSMGRPLGTGKGGVTVDPAALVRWRLKHQASIAKTADHFKVSESSVKRYCSSAA